MKKPRSIKTERRRDQKRIAQERRDADTLRERYRADVPVRDDGGRYRP